METRSRKRAESSAPRPSPAKRARRSARPGHRSASLRNTLSELSIQSGLESLAPIPTPENHKKQVQKEDDRGATEEIRAMGKEKEADKGKEKELEREKERVRDEDRPGKAGDQGNDAEVNRRFHQNFASASAAINGVRRELGAGFDDILPPPGPLQASKFKKILSDLRAEGEEDRQLEALSELCELLSIGTEDSLGCFPADSFVPLLVGLLNLEYNPDMMLLAARALTHLCDALPFQCGAVVRYGAIPCLCARLLTIEYIDLAEQSLQALSKLSREHPTACLRAGALMAVLSYLDFFATGVQRVAVSTAANICRQLPVDAFDTVMDVVPILTNLLQYQDSKVVEHASICLTRIAESFASSPEKLEMLCSHGLIPQAVRLITVSNASGGMVSQTLLSNSTYTGLIRLLSTCARGSAVATENLLLLNISSVLKDILAGAGLVSSISVAPSAVNRPPEQLCEIVTFVNELLPPMPQSLLLPNGVTCTTKKQSDGADSLHVVTHERPLRDQTSLLIQFGTDLFPVLVQVYGSSVNPTVRQKCLAAINKLVHFSTVDTLHTLFKELNISSFLAGVLASKDPYIVMTALQIMETLMLKLPHVFTKLFVKEGVVHAIDSLIAFDQGFLPLHHVSFAGRSRDLKSRPEPRRRSTGSKGETVSEAIKDLGSVPISKPPSSSSVDASSHMSKSGSWSLAIVAARHFKDKYFSSSSGIADAGVTESLSKLKTLCSKLSVDRVKQKKCKRKGKGKSGGRSSTSDEIKLTAIAKILTELGRGDGVSTFEFVACGLVESLLKYFSCGKHFGERISDARLREEALRRLKQFVILAIPANDTSSEPPMTVLVRKLQNALASLERFPVFVNDHSRTGSDSIAAGLSALARPFKVQLSRDQGERNLRDYSSTIVRIHPLATLSSIERYLWPRVQRSDRAQNSSTALGKSEGSCAPEIAPVTSPDTAAPASSSKGKGKVGSQDSVEEHKGPETRNAAARRRAAAAADGAPTSQQSQRDCEDLSGNEEDEHEDLEFSPVHLDDEAVPMEEEEFSDDEEDDEEHEEVFGEEPMSVCMGGDGVHDVRLGDGLDVGNGASTSAQPEMPMVDMVPALSTAFETGPPVGSKNSSSLSAAAMLGVASASEKDVQAGRDHSSLGPDTSPLGVPAMLTFFIDGKPLSGSLTVIQAIQHQGTGDEDGEERFTAPNNLSGEKGRLWDKVHHITYRRAESNLASTSNSSPKSANSSRPGSLSSLPDSVLQGELPCGLQKSNSTYNILLLLRLLDGLNQLAPRLHDQMVSDAVAEGKTEQGSEMRVSGPFVRQEEFLSSKLTSKLARQMQDALALCSGSLPAWCHQLTQACPFLFPFEARKQYFYSTAFGLSGGIKRLQQQQIADNPTTARELRIGRVQRQKVRVSRNHILESAIKVMELYAGHKVALEVEYFGEVGTGLGPTLEFYTLLSRDLQKASLDLWRTLSVAGMEDGISGDTDMQDVASKNLEQSMTLPRSEHGIYVQASYGLFPRPWTSSSQMSDSKYAKVIEHFRLLGRVMGKSIQDGRLLDLPLATAFYKLMLGQELDLYDIKSFDWELGLTLQELQNLVHRKHFLESSAGYNRQALQALRFRNVKLEDLCLYFLLPGYPEYLLKPEGQDILVNLENLQEYISLVVDATVKTGIARQMEAFQAGFNQVFTISSLQVFSEEELDYLLCGRRELWEPETLVEQIKFDHGYTATSLPIRNFLEIMGEFNSEQQRDFLCFVTGAPQLPCGGLAALHPKLTIVRKHPTGMTGVAAVLGSNPPTTLADRDLPSVMTCANYLKLPAYSCKEVMRERLLYAICEGQGSFDLS